ncbi:lipoate--protein ligase family protein [candidate division WOR-3 bacterium]|uniref:Lipoate--protein ligase family protein n=1 Tax=candidate division WOR-3 bacterium TaxID=2052148 RepID=A0A9D5K8Q9_UNCW3|nr:lipoate--protein ligase family protein [candidate division WOR-3 bacterium]MBD3364432.1 lipoate--protein ligase family protein [candidate division WOR-3 bacterium]
MRLYEFDTLPGQGSMGIFHTLAREGIEALCLVSPASPLASVGYFQDASAEIDLAYCAENGVPVMRREVGGGATYLDANQVFYQVILHRDNPLATRNISELYRTLSAPVIATYREFGIETRFRPVNDIVTVEGERKIAGEGAGNIGECMVFVGGILIDFDYETMAHILNVPAEKFRDKIYETINENVTSIYRETGTRPSRSEVRGVLIEKFSPLLGKMEPAYYSDELHNKNDATILQMTRDAFLYKRTMKKPGHVTIRSGVEFISGMHKARGGLLRTASVLKENVLEDVTITGDFTLLPIDGLSLIEEGLRGAERNRGEAGSRIERILTEEGLQLPGVSVEDMLLALKIEE